MDRKRIICLAAGILLLVAGVILLYMGISSGDLTIKIAGGSIMGGGVGFLMESSKKKEYK